MTDRSGASGGRAQTGLPAVAVALLVLTMVTGIGLALGDGAIRAADRDPGERRVAVSLAAGLVGSESPLTVRANVLDERQLSNLTASRLRSTFPVTDDTPVSVELDGEPIATTGGASDGTTIRRLVVVENRSRETIEPALGWQRAVTLPHRGYRTTLTLSPPAGTTVTTVRANDRVVLHDETGLDGTYEISLSRFETTTLRFSANGPLPRGSVEIEYGAIRSRKATLAVTADG